MVLLGVSLHNLWPRSAPRCIRRQAPAAEGEGPPNVDGPQTEDAWHALHSFRVRKTFDFFQRGNLVCTLVLLLQSMQPAYVCMAWMMKHLGVDASCNPDEPGTALPADMQARDRAFLGEFTHALEGHADGGCCRDAANPCSPWRRDRRPPRNYVVVDVVQIQVEIFLLIVDLILFVLILPIKL